MASKTVDPHKTAVLHTVHQLRPEFLRRRSEYGEQPAYNWFVDQLCRCHPYAIDRYICDIAAALDAVLEEA